MLRKLFVLIGIVWLVKKIQSGSADDTATH